MPNHSWCPSNTAANFVSTPEEILVRCTGKIASISSGVGNGRRPRLTAKRVEAHALAALLREKSRGR